MVDVEAKGADVLKHNFPTTGLLFPSISLFPLGSVGGNSCRKTFSFGFPASSVALTGEDGSRFPG